MSGQASVPFNKKDLSELTTNDQGLAQILPPSMNVSIILST